VARHIFQACPVWIYTQSNYMSIISSWGDRVHAWQAKSNPELYLILCWCKTNTLIYTIWQLTLPESTSLWLWSLVCMHLTSVKGHVSITKTRLYSQGDVLSGSVYCCDKL
jgi:hypothetical protein